MLMSMTDELIRGMSVSETDEKNGALIGALMLMAYQKEFDFDHKVLFNAVEKEIDKGWQHKVGFLALAGVMENNFNASISAFTARGSLNCSRTDAAVSRAPAFPHFNTSISGSTAGLPNPARMRRL